MNDEQIYLTYAGAPVKALADGRLSGRIITFSSARSPDRAGEFFDAATDFWLSGAGERRPILYRHGVDPDVKRRRFGEVQISKAADGLWCSGFFHTKDSDSLKLLEMAEAGALNWSTGATGHLAAITVVGSAKHIDEWPIAEVSLCPAGSVAEPRNILSLKSFAQEDTANFYDLVTRSPFSRSAEHDQYQRQMQQRALNGYVKLLQMQHELRMRGILSR